MPDPISRALELATKVEEFPLAECAPDDDPSIQYAYVAGFLREATPFLEAIKRIGDPDLSAKAADFDLAVTWVAEAHSLQAQLRGLIDQLRETTGDPFYSRNIKSTSAFLDEQTLKILSDSSYDLYDLTKLIRFCEEINDSYRRGNLLCCAILIRAVINHVPPLFGCQTFAQVTSQAGRSLKPMLERLNDDARGVADLHTHATITRREVLPSKHQIEPYKPAFELLIQEIIRRSNQ